MSRKGLRERLASLTAREADMVAAACYLAGYLLVWAWDRRRERKELDDLIDRELRQMAADFRAKLDQVRADVPRPDAEREGR